MQNYFTLLLSFIICTSSFCQYLANGDLDGPLEIWTNAANPIPVPYYWEVIEWDDSVCQATDLFRASPDITWGSGPNVSSGIFGLPYSGSTFMSGVHWKYGATTIFQEGIKQTVDSLTIGQEYTVSFYQCVNLQCGFDTSGHWDVYMDNTLIGSSETSQTNVSCDDPIQKWEFRTMTFIATDTIHTVKFLPVSSNFPTTKTRMGIDQINMNIKGLEIIDTPLNSPSVISLFPNPVKSHLTLEYYEHNTEHLTISVYNNSGQLFLERSMGQAGSLNLDLSNLESGIYLIHISSSRINEYRRILKVD